MRIQHLKFLLLLFLACLAGMAGTPQAQASCACDTEQKVRFKLHGIASMAGDSVTVKVTCGDTVVTTTMEAGGAEHWDGSQWVVDSYACVPWDAEITVEPKLDQPVKIEYLGNFDPTDSTPPHTTFEDIQSGNPLTYWSRPSSKCLKVWMDENDGNWILEPTRLVGSEHNTIFRLRGVLQTDDSNIGDGTSPQAGGGQPQPDDAQLTDPPDITENDLVCPGSVSAPQIAQLSSTNSGTSRLAGSTLLPATFVNLTNQSLATDTYGTAQHSNNLQSTITVPLANDDFSGNGYSVSQPIGRLRWEMSLGSVSRAVSLGKLVYQADVLDSTAYSTARLSLADGSDPQRVITDGSGYLRQILLSQDNGSGSFQTLVDIVTISDGFKVDIYSDYVGTFDGTLFPVSGLTPSLTWNVENPDATPMGRVQFTRTEGTDTEVHLAEWTGAAGVAGTMTIHRYSDKWREVREYSLNSNPNQRVETISLYKNGVLQHKSREVYQECYNWGNPGDVFEAMVQQVEDPDGKALTTYFDYYDITTQPANELGDAFYPDGYQETYQNRISLSGDSYAPVAPYGTPTVIYQPFGGDDYGKKITRSFTSPLSTEVDEVDQTSIYKVLNGVGDYREVGKTRKYHYFENGLWETETFTHSRIDSDSMSDFYGLETYEFHAIEIGTRRPVFTQDAQGRTKNYVYEPGYWDPDTQSFGSSGSVQALKTTIINGTDDAQDGIEGKTTVDVSVEDNFGRPLLEESYISDGTGGTSNDRLISRTVHTYTDGLEKATYKNDRLVYQATYYPNGKLETETDESGQEADYTYDEMLRVHQKTILGRGGDPDQVITYEYDVMGNLISDTRTADGLTAEKQWNYDLAGELASSTDVNGLTTQIETDYSLGNKIVTETLPTQATRVTSYYIDRSVYSITGTAVDDEYRFPDVYSPGSGQYLEYTEVDHPRGSYWQYSIQVVNWLGDEILFETLQFQGAGYRDRYTYYDTYQDSHGLAYTRRLPVEIDDAGRATQLSSYDDLGRLTAQGFDLNGNGVLDPIPTPPDEPEPITTYDRSFVFNSTDNEWEDVNTVQRYLQDNSGTQTLWQQTKSRVPAALSGDETSHTTTELAGGGTTASTVALNPSTGEYTSTVNDQEHNQVWSTVQRDGLLRSETQPGIATPRAYTYTALGETATVSDPVTGNLTYTYDATTRQLLNVKDSLNRETDYSYYPSGGANAGRIKGVRDAGGNWTYFDYYPAGQIYQQWGVNTYPVQYQYNEAGNMTQMKTFRTAPGTVDWSSSTWPNPPGGDITQWTYDDAYSGLLQSKTYPDAGSGQKTVNYSYDSGNFLHTKVNGRLQTITYGFNPLGQLHTLTYSDGTPSATLDYDRAGRLDSVVDAAGTHSVSWTDRDQMENENYTAGLLSGVSVNRVYDSQFRLSRIELAQSGVTQTRERFVYDPISWLDYAVEENADGSVELRRYDYTFQAGTPFVGSVAYFEASSPLMTQNYSHDSLGRLSGASAVLAGGPTAYGVNYQFDPNYDRRTEADLADGTKWNFGYNNRSEVTSGKRQLASGAKAGGEQFEYTFDDIGNRIQTKAGGDAAGNNLRSASYTANALNQISQRGVPESLWLVGDAPSALTLLGAVSGSAGVPPAQAFTIQRQENGRFFGEAPVDNSSDPVYARMTIAGKNGSTLADFHTGYKFTPKTPENFTYDDDGNLTGDGQWTYTWDAENQLTRMVSATQVGPPMRIDFKYDWMGRRISKTVWNNTGGTGTPALDERFVYDGWNLIAILNSQSAILDSFIWGLDLSGTMQGAGGVGGLLSMTVHSGPQAGTYYYGYNGNGNVMGLVKANGIIAAQYEYGPFGEVIRSTGPMAKANPFRFSTKYQDDESELLYYGRRYYTPSTGTWLSRDNIEERGGVNLYGFVLNNPVLRFDIHGLSVDPNSIVGPDIAVGISRVGPTFVNSLLMNNARNPLFPYETVRKNGTPLALLANFAFNNPGFRGNGVNRFVFTCKCGWIDSGHFWSSALGGHGLGSDTAFLLGVFVEEVQGIKIKGFEGWSNSSYTAEDLPSDLLGSLFGQSLRGKDYALIPRLFEQLLKDCGAVDPAKLSPEQWKLLRQEAIGWERDLVRNHDAYPKRAKACTALCPGTKQSQDDDFTRILQNLSR